MMKQVWGLCRGLRLGGEGKHSTRKQVVAHARSAVKKRVVAVEAVEQWRVKLLAFEGELEKIKEEEVRGSVVLVRGWWGCGLMACRGKRWCRVMRGR